MTEVREVATFEGEKHIVLETYRKTGEGVRTPVWFVQGNETIYVRTGQNSGKMKRLRNNGRLKLAISNARGTPGGSWTEGKHWILKESERGRIIDQMREKYGLTWKLVGLLQRFGKNNFTIIAITPAEPQYKSEGGRQ